MITIIVILFLTIILHELGHLVAAVLCKTRVEVFSIGFGKPAFGFMWKNIRWQITPWIFGGYCQLYGEQKKIEGGFLNLSYTKKVIIALAGITVNLVIAMFCWWLNYKNLQLGLYVDWIAVKAMCTSDYVHIQGLLYSLHPNMMLFQMGLLNFSCAILNFLPIPALDGGYLWLFGMEKIWKENYEKYLNILTTIFFNLLMVGQVIFIIWWWF